MCCCSALGPRTSPPCSPSRAHHDSASTAPSSPTSSSRAASQASLQLPCPLGHPNYLCPLPATLNTCPGERQLPQGAFHSGKSQLPHRGSCFWDIPHTCKAPRHTQWRETEAGRSSRVQHTALPGKGTWLGDPIQLRGGTSWQSHVQQKSSPASAQVPARATRRLQWH